MRKNFSILSVIALLWFSCDSSKEPQFTVDADISGVEESTMIYLKKVIDGKMEAIDSAILKNSKVQFKGILERPEMIYLNISDTRKAVNVFCENSPITVKVHVDNLDKAVVRGSSVHDDLMEFKAYLKPVDEKSTELNERYREAATRSDNAAMEEVVSLYDALRIEQISMIKKFVDSKPTSYISPFIIRNYLAYDMEVEELEAILTSLDSSVYDAIEYANLNERVETLKSVAIGQTAVDFALNDTTGNPIAISTFRGKILLIDFWASWCRPCRIENPNVVELYNDFNDKDFEIIGVSFDEDRDRWIQAIQDDGLIWPHVSDLKGWQSAAGKMYAINAIPATVLLDREGKIVAKNLRGDALRAKLEEMYAAEASSI